MPAAAKRQRAPSRAKPAASKRCVQCRERKPTKEYWSASTADSRAARCKRCVLENAAADRKQREARQVERDARAERAKAAGKTCKACKAKKAITEFAKYPQALDGHRLICKPCAATAKRQTEES
jgi:hypothetical protein